MSDKKEMYLVKGSNSAHCCFELSICTKESFNGVELDSSVAEFMDGGDEEMAYKMIVAPEMYEMLDMLMEASGTGDAAHLLAEERENIMALLARARGEQS